MGEYDDIIVGGGSAGIALATRLTEDEARQVLLIEAGPDHPGIADADRLGDQMRFAATLTDWAIDAAYVSGGAELNYPRGRKMGGGSAVNGAFAVRGVDPHGCTDEQMDALRRFFSGPQLATLTTAVAVFDALARVRAVLSLPEEDS